MDETQIQLARMLFRARIDSLRNDVMRCFWPSMNPSALPGALAPPAVYSPPATALFPAIMYCFATVDYFSGFWEGWSDHDHRPTDRTQNRRMTDFLCKFLRYPRTEAFVAISVWRHKLMHTAQPRIVRSTEPRAYVWAAGVAGFVTVGEVEAHHMRLEALPSTARDPNRSLLYFDCYEFVRDLDEGVFGPAGYFTALLGDENYELPPQPPPQQPPAQPLPPARRLRQNYLDCFNEMEGYQINFRQVGL